MEEVRSSRGATYGPFQYSSGEIIHLPRFLPPRPDLIYEEEKRYRLGNRVALGKTDGATLHTRARGA